MTGGASSFLKQEPGSSGEWRALCIAKAKTRNGASREACGFNQPPVTFLRPEAYAI